MFPTLASSCYVKKGKNHKTAAYWLQHFWGDLKINGANYRWSKAERS